MYYCTGRCYGYDDERNEDGYDEYYLWLKYEEEKKKIQNIGLTPREYEREIKRICDELGI